ncbi:phage tail tape measure protein [Pseudomonas typographi]|uniref:Phage tail tape measure protein n=3 Tax=Pseudomonas typographi TaxID=2715964 RepID=A0ABR7ZA47_9PSED|nr:phage tail tape measure protein [Pseudomonas typographi]MBD1590202.1 phage tail tape measure protein [Pseudomonas typographi]MBD1602425.1 phage tail tape measure protein [Pseudomonas typographi]
MASRSLGTLTLDLVAKIGGFQQGMDQAARSVSSTGAAATKASSQVEVLERQFASLTSVAAGIAAPLAAAFSLHTVYEATEAYGSLTNRLKLVTSGSAELATAQAAVFGIAQDSRQPLAATAELYQRIATNQTALKLSSAGVAGVVGTISKTLAISGASAESANAALIQLGQAFASGTLRGEELGSVLEQAPALSQAIAAGMGKTVAELRSLGAQGKLTAEAVVKALQAQAGAVDTLFSKMSATIGGSLTVVGNSVTHFIGEIDQATGTSSKLAAEIISASKVIDGSLPAALDGLRDHSDALSQALTTGLYVALAKVVGGYAALGTAGAARMVASAQEAKATLAAAAAATRKAEVDLVVAKNAVQVATLNKSLATTADQIAIAENALTAAKTKALTISTTLAAARTAEAAANTLVANTSTAAGVAMGVMSRAATTLATAGKSVLALMGGPVGLVFIAGAAALSFVDFRSSADKAAEGLEGLKGPLDDVIAKFKALTRDQKAAAMVKWSEAEAESIKAVGEEYSKLQGMLQTGLVGPRSNAAGTSAYQEYSKQLNELYTAGKDLSPVLEKMKTDARVPASVVDSLIKHAGAVSTLKGVSTEATDHLNALRGEMNKGVAASTTSTQATQGLTAAGEKYIQTMQDQLGKLEDNNDVVKEAARYVKNHTELSKADGVAIMSLAYAQKAQQEINKAATKETKENTKAQTALTEQLKQAATGYLELKKSFDPAGAATEQFQKSTAQLNLLYKNGKISQQEYAQGTAWLTEQLNTATKAANGLSQAEEYRQELQKKLANDMAQYANQAAAVGQGDKEADRAQQRLELERETNEKLLSLRTELANATTAKQRNELQAQIDLTNEYLPKQRAAMEDGFKNIDQAQAEWSKGARAAFKNYADQAADVAGQTKTLFSDAFNNMEDGIVNFVKTGKLSFKDFADGVIEDLIRIQVRQAAAGFLSTAFSFLTGGSAALGASVMTGSSSGSLVANAKGGVYDSTSLSAYSNQIYNSPQMFAFAKGAGIFAEAGPEAIMPLTRAADGSLGVRALSTGDTTAAESAANSGTTTIGGITQHITVQGSADDATLARIAQASKKGAEDGYALVISDLKRNGPVRQLLNRR